MKDLIASIREILGLEHPWPVVIIGAGEVGYHIAVRLSHEDKDVTVIDRNVTALRRLSESVDVKTLEGSGSSPKVMDEAGVAEADVLLAVTDSDDTNLIACFFANVLAPNAVKLARIRNEEYTLYRDALAQGVLNIGMVINPEVEVVKAIDRLITLPGAIDYSEFVDGRIRMVALRAPSEPHEFMNGLQLMDFRQRIGMEAVIVAAIVREERLIIPTGKDVIKTGDLVYMVCEQGDLPELMKRFGCEHKPIRNVLIVGGGNIGLRLAGLFELRGYHAKLVDRDPERCNYLADKLDKVMVLHGDGTDQDFLREENVGAMDMVISLTGDEETNILTCLLAKSLGAAKTITRINKSAYLPLVRAIGIEHSISPRLAAVNSILQYVRRGNVIASQSIRGEKAEALEAIAQEGSGIVGKPIKDLDFPSGAIILCIIRGDKVLIPTGDRVIRPQDRIIILSVSAAISRVEQVLSVKLEYV